MLNWWLGKPAEGGRAEDGSEIEPPETPAPVFAARALKSAIFGTPRVEDDEDDEDAPPPAANKPQSRNLSPVKPQGILLTPGTASNRRKTVSFGHDIADKAEKNAGVKGQGLSRSGMPDDCPGKFPSPWTVKGEGSDNNPARKTSLTRQLERARERKDKKPILGESKPLLTLEAESSKRQPSESQSEVGKDFKKEQSNQELLQELIPKDGEFDADATVDLNQPHSQSGRFWKSEFEVYHKEAKVEMKKLLTYKEMAKSYAKAKDAEAAELGQKLKEEQRRVLAMEDKISKLSAKIAASGDGSDDESPELIRELARQTALALQYKDQVEEFRAALEGNSIPLSPQKSKDGKRYISPKTERTISETRQELKKAREQMREMVVLQDEVESLRKNLSESEKKATKLEEENAKLTQEMLHADLRLEKHLEKCEKKRQSLEEQRQKKDEALQKVQTEYDDLKDRSKHQRKDAEHLLRKKHDHCVELRKELASLKGLESTVKDLQEALEEKTKEHDRSVEESQEIINDLRKELAARDNPSNSKNDKMLPPPPKASVSSDDRPVSRDGHIPIAQKTLSQSISRPSKAAVSTQRNRSDTPNCSPAPRRRSSHSALSEIVNSASSDSFPGQKSGPVQHTPVAPNRFSNQNLDLSLDLELPSPEPPANYGNSARPPVLPSPRPSRFNFDIASSPPKPVMVRSQTTGELVGKDRNRERLQVAAAKDLGSSRLGSINDSRVRKEVPPERAAAAKARLEQRRKEREGGGGGERDKENVRV